ncbi:hypothetical protein [Mycolicibacterium madagascariense]|nr:hypothetical protein [Mycolicibacterium madagascariense]MCV7013424.1 hypothetical protein [Mycolicibacterium madagascariense]
MRVRRVAAVSAAAVVLGMGLTGVGTASADPGCGYYCQNHGGWHGAGWHDGWHHPEWAGWNDGYPGRGWVPPRDWYPPRDWVPPAGWYPPPGYAPPPDWVGPCAGPLFDLFHPIRCL